MRITEVFLDGSGLPSRITLSTKPQKSESKNWITVLSGENGTRKSLLLRLITAAALDRPLPSSNHKRKIEARLADSEFASHVFAISGTYSDRFPQVVGVPISRPLSGFDLDKFSYFGPRYAGNVAGKSRIATCLLISILENPILSSEREDSVGAVLKCLGYTTRVRALVVPRNDLKRSGKVSQLIRNHVVKTIGYVSRSDSNSARQLLEFLENLVQQDDIASAVSNTLQYRDIVLDLAVEGLSATEQQAQLIPFLKTGLLVVSQFEFERLSIEGQDQHDNVSVEDLSSGQLQLLNNLLNLALNVKDDSLILIDEPENSLHPEWRREYISVLRQSIDCVKRCHVVLATHSPLVASGVKRGEGSLIGLKRDAQDDSLKVSPSETVHGWLPSAVLEERFDMPSVRAPELTSAVETALKLLKSPNVDKVELEKACKDLKVLLSELPSDDVIVPAIEAIIELGAS